MAGLFKWLDLKNQTANFMGRTDGATPDNLRDSIINWARGSVYSAYNFSWLYKKVLTITTDTNGVANMPDDYNPTLLLKDVRIVNSGSNDDTVFKQIKFEDKDAYSTGATYDSVCWVTYDAASSLYVLNTNQPSVTLSVYYPYIPADFAMGSTEDTFTEPCPDPDAIVFYAVAKLWIAKERDETNHDRFDKMGDIALQGLIAKDKFASPNPEISTMTDIFDLGYNGTSTNTPIMGYRRTN